MVSGTKTTLPLRQLYRAFLCENVVPVVRVNVTPCMIIHNPLLVTENPEKESIFCLISCFLVVSEVLHETRYFRSLQLFLSLFFEGHSLVLVDSSSLLEGYLLRNHLCLQMKNLCEISIINSNDTCLFICVVIAD